jgi:nucleolar protein 56
MRAYIATNILGCFAFDEKGDILEKLLFPKDPDGIAQRLAKARSGQILDEERRVIKALLARGVKEIVWDKQASFTGVETSYDPDNLGKRILNEQFRKFALEMKWASSQAELNELLTKVNIALTKTSLKKPRRDYILMRVVGLLDELDRMLNTSTEHLREWYGLYFPEAVKAIKSNEEFVELSKAGERKAIPRKEIAALAGKTAGTEFTKDDIQAFKSVASVVSDMFKQRKDLAEYLENAAREAIPNMNAIAGPVLASRMLSIAGGLEKMAKMPASTIQILGAEKALFRHMREKTKAPKYGVLFSHPYIQKAPKDKKGKVARIISAKLSLAARTDFFSGEDRSEQFRSGLEKQVSQFLVRA